MSKSQASVFKTLSYSTMSFSNEIGFGFESQKGVNQNNESKIRNYGRHVCDRLPCILVSPVRADLTRRGALCAWE